MKFKGLPLLNFLCVLAFLGKGCDIAWLENSSHIALYVLSLLTVIVLGLVAIKYWREFPPFNLAKEHIFVEWDSFGIILVGFMAGCLGWRDITCIMIVSWVFLVYCRGKEPIKKVF